ncbi:hypothetical protein LINPERHAP1_LOCUS13577, partial [Linum perenne]
VEQGSGFLYRYCILEGPVRISTHRVVQQGRDPEETPERVRRLACQTCILGREAGRDRGCRGKQEGTQSCWWFEVA